MRVKERLTAGETVFGQMVMELFSPGVAQMMDRCGLEFAIFDMEHGRCDLTLAAQMIDSCRGTNIAPMVRVPDLNSAPLSRVLDLGAVGVMIPRVETGVQMQNIVAQLKYAPDGRRGVALSLSHDRFRAADPDYFAKANRETMIIALLETATAFENLDEILSVPGVDVGWMGHYDLTVSMGIPAQFNHPRFLDAMDRLVDRCNHYGVAPGFLPATAEDASFWIQKGFRMISLGSDIGVYVNALEKFRREVMTRQLATQ